MPRDRRHPEARFEALEEGFCQRDFRKEHQDLAPLLDRGRDGFEIGFGLARARHAVEQKRMEVMCIDRRDKAGSDFRLFIRQVGRGKTGVGGRIRPVRIDHHRFKQPGIDHAA